MGAGIFLIGADGRIVERREEPYESEDVLQQLLAAYPQLLAGDEFPGEEPGSVHKTCGFTAHQPRQHRRVARVAAGEPVLAELDQLARYGQRFRTPGPDLSGIGGIQRHPARLDPGFRSEGGS